MITKSICTLYLKLEFDKRKINLPCNHWKLHIISQKKKKKQSKNGWFLFALRSIILFPSRGGLITGCRFVIVPPLSWHDVSFYFVHADFCSRSLNRSAFCRQSKSNQSLTSITNVPCSFVRRGNSTGSTTERLVRVTPDLRLF